MAFHIIYGNRGDMTQATRVSTSKAAYPEARWPLMHKISDGLRPGEAYLDIIGHFEGPLSPATATKILAMRSSAPAIERPVGHFPFEALEPKNVASRTEYIQSLRFGSKRDELFPAIEWPNNLILLKHGVYKSGTISVRQDQEFFPLTLEWLSQFGGYLHEKFGKHQLLRKDAFTEPLTLSIRDLSTLLQRLNVFAKPQGYILGLPSYPMTEALFPTALEFEDSDVSPFSVIQRLMGRTDVIHYLRDTLDITMMPTSSWYERDRYPKQDQIKMSPELNPQLEYSRYYFPSFRYISLANLGEEIIKSGTEEVPGSTVILQRSPY